MPPGPAVIGYPYQFVLQSATAAASSVRYVAVPGGDEATIQMQICVLTWTVFLFSICMSHNWKITAGKTLISSFSAT